MAILSQRYAINALDLTTRELMHKLSAISAPGLDRGGLERWLEHTDMVKFAKGQPASADAATMLDFFEALVWEYAPARTEIDQGIGGGVMLRRAVEGPPLPRATFAGRARRSAPSWSRSNACSSCFISSWVRSEAGQLEFATPWVLLAFASGHRSRHSPGAQTTGADVEIFIH